MQTLLVKALKHHHQHIKCSVSDHFVFRIPVSVVFFYQKAISSELIIDALEHVLGDFPIFAGVLIKQDHQLYIDCNNQGVQVNIVHSDQPITHIHKPSDFSQLEPTEFVDKIHPQKNLKKRQPLLTIKLSYYSDGMTIGYCWHHTLGDMATFMEFLKALSAYAAHQPYQPALITEDRENYLKEWVSKTVEISNEVRPSRLKKLNLIDILHFIKQVFLPKRMLYFYFTPEEIEALRVTMSEKVGRKLSRNDVLCAHLLRCLAHCRTDHALLHSVSIAINYRPRLGMPSNLLGNYVDAMRIQFPKHHSTEMIADTINRVVSNYLNESFYYDHEQTFLKKNGGLKKLKYVIPQEFLPQCKNLLISNWSNFGVYTIDFGIAKPYLFLPVGRPTIPWMSCVVEGYNNKGLFVAVVLPARIAKRLSHPSMLKQVHAYRESEVCLTLEGADVARL